MTLGGKRQVKEIFNLHHLAEEFMMPELSLHTRCILKIRFVVSLMTQNRTLWGCLQTQQMWHTRA